MEKLHPDNIYVPRPLQRLFFILFFSLQFLFVTPLMATEQEPPLTEQAIETLSNTPPETTIEQDIAREQESQLEEDPLTRQQIQKMEQPESTAKDINYLRGYGSARIRYRITNNDGQLDDGGSRIGLTSLYQLAPEYNLLAGMEAGINLFDELDFLFNRGNQSSANQFGNSLFTRLFFAGFETPRTSFTFGKSWSTYYKVSSYTDRFDGTGASASGTFNAFSDGGSTGTGRADMVFQTRLHIDALPVGWGIKPFNLNIQIQQGEKIPGLSNFQYGTTIGLSAVLTTTNDYTIGLAYNQAMIDQDDLPQLRNNGIKGDARAMLIGTRWFSENWYIGAVMARLLNHESTGKMVYFDGWGSELYLQYQPIKNVYLVSGYNYLKPDSGQPLTGFFQTKYMVFGLRYAFNNLNHRIFLAYQLEDSRTTNNLKLADTVTLGIRWDFP